MYQGSPQARFVASQSKALNFLPKNKLMVPGKVSSELAKIGGNDAARIHAQRQISHLPAHHAPAHHALGILHGDTPLPTFHKNDDANHADHQGHQENQRQARKRSPLRGPELVKQIGHRSRQVQPRFQRR